MCSLFLYMNVPLYQHFRYMNIFLSTWCLMVAGMVFATPMVCLRVTDYTYAEDANRGRGNDRTSKGFNGQLEPTSPGHIFRVVIDF
ncbi:hypothetical protein EDB19DRAFT_965043 [Suillus lakei]|nr:hypothetical protein EDB19DRAFT_965043 [Suillus lakei]